MGGKFAKKIVAKVVSVRNTRAFVEQQRELKRRGEPVEVKPSSLHLPTLQGEAAIGSSGVAKVKSREVVESDKDDNGNNSSDSNNSSNGDDDRPRTVASKEGKKDMEMRETTPLVMVAEVEWEASDMEVKGEEEFEAAPVTIEEDKEEDKGAEEVKVQQQRTWSDMPLQQVGNNELEWLGKDLAWLMPLMPVVLLANFDERAAGVEQWF
ncbi:hypothetical protein E4T56_gene16913 [Termitomyces sp. T112]|nr:hypothetical protein E4T56_gene16913 [Termitomyces sp. T112]